MGTHEVSDDREMLARLAGALVTADPQDRGSVRVDDLEVVFIRRAPGTGPA